MSVRKVFIHAYGCQMNKLDAELVLGALLRDGYEQSVTPEEADVILYHTCSVRKHAEERVYSNVGKLKFLKRRKPDLVIGILGCMAQKDKTQIFKRLPHVDIVCGTREFNRVPDLIEEVRRDRHQILSCNENAKVDLTRNIVARPSFFQAYVSVMRGCDNFCAYCIVPHVRGREISRPIVDVVDEVKRLVDNGCREITLLGQNVNSYGKSFGKRDALADLLPLLDNISGLDRLRFVTSHPKDMSRSILEAVRDLPSVCEHLHMPAQSGSDRILAAMKRRYTSTQYRDLVALARDLVPNMAILSDFIVGFPGETEEDFELTAGLIRDMRFQNSFVFKYSPRPGTRAADLDDDVLLEDKKRRNVALLKIQSKISLEMNRGFMDQDVEVLVEGVSRRDPNRLTGRTRANQIVTFQGPDTLSGQIVRVRINDATPLTLSGTHVLADA